ncbi:MAG TPA: helix-turn-helix domain-containing protein [Coleofasciculaceae cyanobacterium]
MSLRPLEQRELLLFRLYRRCQFGMSPHDFYAKWEVTHLQMAQICHCSVPTVDRWFAGGSGQRAPTPFHQRRLAEVDLLWETYEEIPLAIRRRFCSPRYRADQDLSP